MADSWNLPGRRLRAVSPLGILNRPMAAIFDEFLGSVGEPWSALSEKSSDFSPRLELVESDVGLTVRAEMPGMKVEDVEITLTKNEVTLRGERKSHHEEKREGQLYKSEWLYGSFMRTIPLGFEVDEDKVEATVQDGILTIKLPKSTKAKSETKKVTIKKC